MFKPFLTALVYEMVQLASKHPDFFEKDAKAREADLSHLRFPPAFKDYLQDVSAENFMKDLHLVLRFANGEKQLVLKGNAFFKALTAFFVGPFADKLDKLTNDFYLFDHKDQEKVVDALLGSDTRTAKTLKNLLLTQSYQNLTQAIYRLGSATVGMPYVLVQSPREMSPELKKEIRKQFREDPAKGGFPIFQINRKLIGGLRVFQDGETIDHSWLSRVHRFTSLTSV